MHNSELYFYSNIVHIPWQAWEAYETYGDTELQCYTEIWYKWDGENIGPQYNNTSCSWQIENERLFTTILCNLDPHQLIKRCRENPLGTGQTGLECYLALVQTWRMFHHQSLFLSQLSVCLCDCRRFPKIQRCFYLIIRVFYQEALSFPALG